MASMESLVIPTFASVRIPPHAKATVKVPPHCVWSVTGASTNRDGKIPDSGRVVLYVATRNGETISERTALVPLIINKYEAAPLSIELRDDLVYEFTTTGADIPVDVYGDLDQLAELSVEIVKE